MKDFGELVIRLFLGNVTTRARALRIVLFASAFACFWGRSPLDPSVKERQRPAIAWSSEETTTDEMN